MLLNQERNQIDAALYKSCRFSSRFILLDAAAPVKSYHEELGEISSYPPGYKENAGTAAWTFVNVSQYILGIQPTPNGLRIDPCPAGGSAG